MIEEVLTQIKNKKPMLAVTLALAGVIVANLFIVQPMIKGIKGVVAEKEAILKKDPAIRATMALEGQFEKYKNVFPQTSESTQIIGELNSLAADSGFVVQSIIPEPVTKVGANFEKLSVRVDAEGSYHKLGEFVSRIENLKYLVKLARVELGNSKYSPEGSMPMSRGEGLYKISLTVNLLYPSKEAGA